MNDFLANVGPAQVHDAVIEQVDLEADRLVVTLRSDSGSGSAFQIEFEKPAAVAQNRAVGMKLYTLAELISHGRRRRFSFVAWDEDDDARLDLEAQAIRW